MPLPLVPLAIAGGLAAAGAVGTVASGALSKTKSVGRVDADPGLYALGGDPAYAQRRTEELQRAGRAAQMRNLLSPTSDADYRQGISDYQSGMGDYRAGLEGYQAARGQQQQSRAEQMKLLGTLSQATTPGADSAGQQQMRAGTEDAALNALNIAATGRGGAGSTMAALDANVMGAQRANRDGAMLAAQERAQARGELAGLTSSIRQGDMAAMDAEQGYARLGQGAAQLGQGLSGLGMQQQGIGLQQQGLSLEQQRANDAQFNAMLQGEMGINDSALQGSMAYGNNVFQAGLQQQQINAQLAEAARQRKANFWGGLIGAGGGVATAGIMSGKK